MFASIRKYRTSPGSAAELSKRVNDGFVPIISKAQGYVAYYVMDAGNDIVASISIFQDKDEAEQSVQMAAEWVKQNIASLLPNPPEIMARAVTVQGKKSFNQMAAGSTSRYRSKPAATPPSTARWVSRVSLLGTPPSLLGMGRTRRANARLH